MEEQILVLDEGLAVEEVAAEMSCCRPQTPVPT